VPAERWSGIPAPSQIFLTSGSTGNATGVIRSPGAVLADARRVGAFLGYRPDVPVLACAPLFHVYGFNYALIAPLLSGAPMSFVSPRSVPSQLHREAHRHAARTLIALPHHYGLLATSPRAAPVAGGLRTCVSAGAPLAAGVAGRLLGRYSFTLYNCYGSSEAGAVTLKPVTGMDDAGDVGAPLPGISARIAAADGVRGELLLSSDGLAAGRMSSGGVVPLDGTGGWYRTGDLASIDPATGAIQLLGRVKTMINVAGEKVSPAEIEQVLAAHPAVLDVQVLAASDRTRGQVPVARVVVTNAAAEDLLIGWCRERLAPHQVPRRIERVAAIPRSATGKPLIRDETSSPEA
jgi:acyl-coenzyme A synthetase/AMP-(fatty) acid ligase